MVRTIASAAAERIADLKKLRLSSRSEFSTVDLILQTSFCHPGSPPRRITSATSCVKKELQILRIAVSQTHCSSGSPDLEVLVAGLGPAGASGYGSGDPEPFLRGLKTSKSEGC